MVPPPPAPPSPEAQGIHEALVACCRDVKIREHQVAILLAKMCAREHHRELGYASIHDYAEQVLDLSVRQSRALLHIGRALPDFPQLDAAFAEGKIGWTKAREVVRVATPETEAAWVERATHVSSRTLEDQVARSERGEGPPDPDDPPPKARERRRVTFDMSTADANAVFCALAMLRQQSGASYDEVDDGVLLASLASRVLYEANDATPPSAERYRVLLELCPRCGKAEGAHAALPVSVVSEAQCDAEIVDLRPGDEHGHASRTIPPATRRAVLARDRYQCVVPGCRNRVWLDVHHLVHREHGGTNTLDNLITTCTVHHRMTHAGQLTLWRDGDDVWCRFADGRCVSVRRPVHDPRGSRSRVRKRGAPVAKEPPAEPQAEFAPASADLEAPP